MPEFFSDPAIWAGLATLTLMEVVLGIDNIVFISILAGKLPKEEQNRARILGLSIAGVVRVAMLFGISWLMSLTKPFIEIDMLGFYHPLSGRDLILLIGGLFLVYKSVKEIHEKLEGEDDEGEERKKISFTGVIIQIILLDIIFSLDSVITAVGMTDHLWVMITATMVALAVMILSGNAIGNFVMKHPTVKMLALSFLLLIGVSLGAEAFHREIPKGYIYAAMVFSLFVEGLNLAAKARKKKSSGKGGPVPVHLRRNVVGMNLSKGEAEPQKAEI